jgi:anaerobic selenocysteine-containing dehydrogenase
MCGLRFEVDGQRIVSVAPDEDDVFSKGYICPKGAAIASLYNDPDRLRAPMRRTPAGDFEPIGWDEAFELTARKLREIRAQYGGNAIGLYMGNPMVHNHGALVLRQALMNALGTRNCTSSGSQDTSVRFAVSWYLYGNSLAIPIPDVDRTHYLFMLGANPRVSQGSFMTAPDIRGRLQAIRRRGGRVVVVDPRRTETARDADEHVAILPGGDAALLLSMVQVLLSAGRVDRARLEQLASGWQAIESRLAAFEPERASGITGLEAATIRRLAHEFADAPTSVAYSRVGVCNTAYGTAASLATDLLNLAAGRLGAVGGAMFPTPAFDPTPIVKYTGADGHDRWRSRVRGLSETLGDLPAATMAEEIETPGAGQVRAMVVFAGNPVLSVPNGRRLSAALEKLDFMVAIDLYVNETTRHADVILPPAWSLCDDHVDLIMSGFAVRNVVRWSPPVLDRPSGEQSDWQILWELIYRLGGGPVGLKAVDWLYRLGRKLGFRWRPDSTVDLLLRLGPYGDRFLPWSKGLNLKKLKAATHGIDLGPLVEGIAHRVVHRDGRAHLDAPVLLGAIDELIRALAVPSGGGDNELLLIGRRELRSNNSWMHNVPELVSGHARCVLLVHPDDAAARAIGDGETAILESRVHSGEVPVKLSDEMRPGVVCLPHGWGHAESARWQRTAGRQPGVSFNDWTDDASVESVVGQSILNGVRVRLSAKGDRRAAQSASRHGETVGG